MKKLSVYALCASFTVAEPTVLDKVTFNQLVVSAYNELMSEKGWLIMFYAPWCGHCKKLLPTWDELSDTGININIGKVDCTTSKEVCDEYSIKGYPSLQYFPNDRDF